MLSLFKKSSSIMKSLTPMLSASYHDNVINRFENPTNVGSLDPKKKTVGTGIISKIQRH